MSDNGRPSVEVESCTATSIHVTITTDHGDVVIYADRRGEIIIQTLPANVKVRLSP